MEMNSFEVPPLTPEWHDVATVTLGELIEGGWFNWDNGLFNWSNYAYSPEQYARVCEAFKQRFYFREISMLPPKRWAMKLMYEIKYNISPVCNELYKLTESSPLYLKRDSYGKRRKITSDYPETLLSGNADYISAGHDEEYEDLVIEDVLNTALTIAEKWQSIDDIFLNRCSKMFSDLVASVINDY